MKSILIILSSLLTACAGTNGNPGIPGNDGTTVKMMQFCPQYTGSYTKTMFPEYGLIVGNIIYAVYWDDKNSWLAEVYPGKYISTSTSAPCTFTVNSNGTITN